jgi:cyclase
MVSAHARAGFCFLTLLLASGLAAQEHVTVTGITPHLLLIGTSTGNVVASVGPDGALLTGTPSVASTAAISRILASRTGSPRRYVVIASEDATHSDGDAGWGKRGAFVAMQEIALGRLGGHMMGPPMPLPQRLIQLGVDRPRMSFSDVLSFDLNGEAIHFIHQPAGTGDADVLVHFHVANLLYFGEAFPGDGYPYLDAAHGANLDALLKTVGSWTDPKFRVVPVYGPLMNGADVQAYCSMLTSVRGSVQQRIRAGQSEQQILASRPTAKFDARWGHGRVSPDQFVRELVAMLSAKS